MSRTEKDQATDHVTQSKDDPTPKWWKWIFTMTLAFSPPYLFWYHCGAEGRTLSEKYDIAFAANLKLQVGAIGELSLTRENVVKYLYEESWLKVGGSIFKANCVSCHGAEGGGLGGPNLCDDNYKNIKDIGDILRVLQNGANGGAMPPWQAKLSPNEIVLVASYVASLRGSNPSVAKPAEGRKIPAWPKQPAEEDELTEVTDE